MRLTSVKTQIVAPLVAMAFLCAPAALADTPFTVHKMVGPIQQKESQIAKEIQSAFDAGLINGYEMAQMQRDLDGIRSESDYYAINSTTRSTASVMKKLNQIENVLDAHAASNLSWEVAMVAN